MKERFSSILKSQRNDASTLLKLINTTCTKDIAQDFDKRIKKEISSLNLKREQEGATPLNQDEVNEMMLDIICKISHGN